MSLQAITSQNYPAAFAAMDAAAKAFWAYPDADWQEDFLRQWAQQNDTALLAVLNSINGGV